MTTEYLFRNAFSSFGFCYWKDVWPDKGQYVLEYWKLKTDIQHQAWENERDQQTNNNLERNFSIEKSTWTPPKQGLSREVFVQVLIVLLIALKFRLQ